MKLFETFKFIGIKVKLNPDFFIESDMKSGIWQYPLYNQLHPLFYISKSIGVFRGIENKSKWLYFIVEIVSFFIIWGLTDSWIIAFIVSGIIGFGLDMLDPLSKT
ncbi:MAG: hypothetical protein FWH29_06455 [Methanobrevibacter sp.]|nr:hypothetical protein [Methanobrevibacter sp.]